MFRRKFRLKKARCLLHDEARRTVAPRTHSGIQIYTAFMLHIMPASHSYLYVSLVNVDFVIDTELHRSTSFFVSAGTMEYDLGSHNSTSLNTQM
jgi:hypothetical protein